MQRSANGEASRRAIGIVSPQSMQIPYVLFLIWSSALAILLISGRASLLRGRGMQMTPGGLPFTEHWSTASLQYPVCSQPR